MQEPGPYLLNVRVTPFENVYPMVPAGGAINEMVLGPVQPVAVGRSMLQLISLLVENKPGALMRVTGVLSARGYNIESLTVARTLDPELSRMSIVVDIESEPARPGDQADQQAGQRAAGIGSHRRLGRTAGTGPAVDRDHPGESHGRAQGSRDLRRESGG